jgi:hypothetical protein
LSTTYSADYGEIWRTQESVRTVVSFLARNVAQLGLPLYERVGDADRQRLQDHPLAKMLRQPNPWTSRYRFISALVHDFSIYNNAYWLKTKFANGDGGLVRIPPPIIKASGTDWLTPSKFSNTYALGLPKQVAEAYPQVNTISDLNQVLRDESQRKHLVALDTEFANRPDGLVGLKEMYDLHVSRANIRQMDAGLVYTAMHNNQVFAGLVYTTDGRLSAFNLKLLEDDKHYFPDYTAAPVVRKQVLDANPKLVGLLKPLAEQLDDETMRQLNAKVDVEHQNPTTVAAAFLREHPMPSEVQP